MLNSKKISLIFLTCLLAIMSIITVNYYGSVKDNQYDIEGYIDAIGYEQKLFLFNLIEGIDSDYDFIQFDESLPEASKRSLTRDLENQLANINRKMKNDPNIQYIIKKNGSTYNNINPYDINTNRIVMKDYMVYSHVSFNNDGEMDCSGNLCQYYENQSLENLLEYYENNVNGSYMNFNTTDGYTILENQITFNNPKGYHIYFLIPKDIVPTGYTYSYLDNYTPTLVFMSIAIILSLLILSTVIFFIPIHIIEAINPFRTIKNWFLEINMILFGGILIGLGALLGFMCKFTTDGSIQYLLEKIHMNISNPALTILNALVWFVFYSFMMIIPFILKYMITSGFIFYIKNHTVFGWLCKKVKKEFLSFQLNIRIIIIIVIFVVLNALFGITAMQYWGDGSDFAIIYSVILFIVLLIASNSIYKKYKLLLTKTNLLSKGQFDIQIEENLGVFEEYKQELLQVKDGFEKAVQEEVKSSNMKTELITNVSHDLKTPITCIKNYVTLLENEEINEETRKEYIKNLHQYTNRLTHLVEDLFEVSKVNSGNISLDLVELDIVDLVKQVLAENEDVFTNANLNVITRLPEEHIQLSLDSEKTYRIFENLIINIGKYAMPHSRVYVDITDDMNDVTITFKNISKDEMNFTAKEIVERFVRGDKSRHESGSGLGLAIVKSYAQIQNGTFDIAIDGDLFKAILTFKK